MSDKNEYIRICRSLTAYYKGLRDYRIWSLSGCGLPSRLLFGGVIVGVCFSGGVLVFVRFFYAKTWFKGLLRVHAFL